MQPLKGIYVWSGTGFDSNVYLIDGEVIVDCGTGDFFAEIKNEIVALGIDVANIRTIVNTHHHFDHTGGDKKFRDWLNANIAIHSADRARLEHGETLAELFEREAKIITTDISLEDKDVIRTKHFSLEVVHTPGHTPGSICLYERKRRFLISGDTLFEDGVGRTDLPGGSAEEMKHSLGRLAKLDIEYLFPGHGGPKIGGVGFLIKQVLAGTLKATKVEK
jgi:glyoxylase-like metal-dependent hydrolase (beta-lactamase superfamily II)